MGSWAAAFFGALKPRPQLTVSEWADRHRRIARGTSPEPGQWRTDRAPYLRGIMDALNDPTVETVAVMMGSQLGKTEVLLNILGYFVDQDPSPILMVQPTIGTMEAFSKERIEPTLKATPALRSKFETGKDGRGASRKSGNTILVKHFPGGYLAMAGSNAPSGLASRPIRVVLCDEVDRFAASAGHEGDPVKLARQRTANFYNRKIVMVSTPTIDGVSKIQEWHEAGDKRQFLVPCPHCGVMQVLVWDRLVYKNEAGECDFDDVHYRCAECDGRIEERDRPAMLADGEWVAQEPGGRVASFGDINALYSPWARWREMAEQWHEIHQDPTREGLREFVNLKLGQPFVEHEQTIEVGTLEERRQDYAALLPQGVLLLTAGVDVQDDRLEVEVVGWGVGKCSWGVEYLVLPGDPSQPTVWEDLDRLLLRTWERVDGVRLPVVGACVDSGGHHTTEVYAFCRARETRRVYAIKGKGGLGVPLVSKPSRNNRFKAALFHLGVDDFKGKLFGRLRVEAEGPGYCQWPRSLSLGYDEAYFRGLLSERLTLVQRGGRKQRVWQKVHDRNEPLDCRVYASGALEILKPDLAALADGAPLTSRRRRSRRGRGRRVLSKGVT